MLQELLTHKLLEAPAIPSGTALTSALSLLLGALFPLLVSPLFTPPFTLAGKRVQEHSTRVKGVWCQHWSTASLRSLRYSHGTWGSGMENTNQMGS